MRAVAAKSLAVRTKLPGEQPIARAESVGDPGGTMASG